MTVLKGIDPNRVKKTEQKKVLAEYIEIQVNLGNSIEEYMGKPLSHFDYEAIKAEIAKWRGNDQNYN